MSPSLSSLLALERKHKQQNSDEMFSFTTWIQRSKLENRKVADLKRLIDANSDLLKGPKRIGCLTKSYVFFPYYTCLAKGNKMRAIWGLITFTCGEVRYYSEMLFLHK